MKNIALAVLILTGCAIAAEKMTTVYKLTKLSPSEVAIYCRNGSDPTGNKVGQSLVITCGD